MEIPERRMFRKCPDFTAAVAHDLKQEIVAVGSPSATADLLNPGQFSQNLVRIASIGARFPHCVVGVDLAPDRESYFRTVRRKTYAVHGSRSREQFARVRTIGIHFADILIAGV